MKLSTALDDVNDKTFLYEVFKIIRKSQSIHVKPQRSENAFKNHFYESHRPVISNHRAAHKKISSL